MRLSFICRTDKAAKEKMKFGQWTSEMMAGVLNAVRIDKMRVRGSKGV